MRETKTTIQKQINKNLDLELFRSESINILIQNHLEANQLIYGFRTIQKQVNKYLDLEVIKQCM